MKKLLIPTLLIAGLSGCMPTKQASPEQIKDAPTARIFPIGAQGEPTGTITVTRDVGFVGSGCYMGVMVDGKMAAHLDPAERLSLVLAEGRHVLTATPVQGRGLCGVLQSEKTNNSRRRSTEINVRAGATQAYRLYSSAEEFPVIEPAF
ncbi:TPA: hypothetical protein ACOENG_002424 [Stenotrophomonas maltophilia]|uniref:Lipoprotein n=1 Tax=Stenotrophomonas maltophilia TaxID=40324 RepID=A0AAI9CKG9_STEMA|nr:hypothetical protein [Stenotrophomonas maltophilia]EJP77028.1 hypothetical protein A1OC_01837 [Stenotrophomonas maltophilia Ab55555]EKT2107076.1 hypothetical protein [Stenotrophomonas maltophilia]EKZ1926912.1 hypothetical protein [Stenotrophomonas maltophilia]EKZ1929553.1 hypothetical protein [Stenotrophomonas maltophilia]ELE7120910.1 hypothetical protein [Stenotrophomonas maltophilia]